MNFFLKKIQTSFSQTNFFLVITDANKRQKKII